MGIFGATSDARASDMDDSGQDGGVFIGAAAFLDFGKDVSRKLDSLSPARPIIKPVGGSAIGDGVTSPILVKVQVSPASGRLWNILRLGVFGSDPHTTVQPGSGIGSAHQITSPGAGQDITGITLPSGIYNLYGTTLAGGTLAAADFNNLELQSITGGDVTLLNYLPLLAPTPGQASWGPYQIDVSAIQANLANPLTPITVQVKSIAAATAGAIYYASLTAVPVAGGVYADVE